MPERWPYVTLAIQEGTSASLEEWVLDRRVDVAVLQDPPTLDGLPLEPVVTERLGFVSGVPDNPLAGRRRCRPGASAWRAATDLAASTALIRRLVDSGVSPRQRSRSGAAGGRRGADQGDGARRCAVPVLPYVAVRDEVARGTLSSFLPIVHDPLLTVLAIACRSGAGTGSVRQGRQPSAARGDVPPCPERGRGRGRAVTRGTRRRRPGRRCIRNWRLP